MLLRAVELADFRNQGAALVEPHPRFNVLAGDNGQGKTNFLEAVYLVGTLRSFRASRLEELVRFGAGSARASARVEREGLERRYDVEVHAEPARKLARVDGKPVRAAADYFGGFNVVLFAPDDLRLPRGSPSGRRRFLDRAVWNVAPAFLKEAQTYEKALKSRNALLRDGGGPRNRDLLEVFDEQLATAGAALALRRKRYLDAIAPRVAEAFERISRSGIQASVRYESALTAFPTERGGDSLRIEPLRDELRALLGRTRPRDFGAGYTTAGPHTDDIEMDLDGKPARLYASQGQLRALVLALKVAEIQNLAAVLGDAPILLLDDVSSELDPSRNAFLFEFLREASGQVFITTTDAKHVLLGEDRRDFRVEAGTVRPLE